MAKPEEASMDPVITIFLQVIDLGLNLAGEARARKASRAATSLYRGIRDLDAKKLSASFSNVKLASMMGATLAAKDAERALADPQVRKLITELFFAMVVSDDKDNANLAEDSLRMVISDLVRQSSSAEDAEAFGAALATAFRELCRKAAEQVVENSPDVMTAFQQTGLLRRATAILQNIQDHHEAIARSTNEATARDRERFISDYRKSCAEKHGYITPPDFKTSRKLPMEQLYVPPRIDSRRRTVGVGQLSMAEFLIGIDRTVVLGDPGGGKSTLSEYVASHLARDSSGQVPFHVVLREFALHSQALSIIDYIERQMGPGYEVALEKGVVRDLLLTGRAVVIFDGLDELLDAGQRRDMQQRVELFSIQYPHAPILVTSRRVGYEQAQLDGSIFSTYHLGAFEESQVAEYATKWFAAQEEYTEQKAKERATAFVEQSATVLDLRRNPLMLSLMCILFRGENYIPKNRPDVYSKCATLLFDQWDGTRGIEVPLQARDHVDAAMKYIAFEFLQSKAHDSGITERVLVRMMSEYLYAAGALETKTLAEKAAQEFVDYCSGRAWVFTDAGSTADDESIYTFTHRTFMEYFAAVHLTRITDTPEALATKLLPRIAAEEWHVVAQLAVQQVNLNTEGGSARALRAILKDGRKRTPENRSNVLKFVVACLAFAVVPVSLVRQIATTCVDFALGADVDDFESWELHPLFSLRPQTFEREAGIAAQQVQDELSSALDRPADAAKARWIVLRFLVLTRNTDISRSSRVDQAWCESMVHLARLHKEAFLAKEEDAVAVALLFAWFGILEPDEALDIVRQPNLAFWGRYFHDEHKAGWATLDSSASRVLMRYVASSRVNVSEEQHDWVEKLAMVLLQDFNAMPRDFPDYATIRLSPRRTRGMTSDTVRGLSVTIADAALIATLGNAELMSGDNVRARGRALFLAIGGLPREATTQLHVLKAVASPELSQAADGWEAGDFSVFSAPPVAPDDGMLLDFPLDSDIDEPQGG